MSRRRGSLAPRLAILGMVFVSACVTIRTPPRTDGPYHSQPRTRRNADCAALARGVDRVRGGRAGRRYEFSAVTAMRDALRFGLRESCAHVTVETNETADRPERYAPVQVVVDVRRVDTHEWPFFAFNDFVAKVTTSVTTLRDGMPVHSDVVVEGEGRLPGTTPSDAFSPEFEPDLYGFAFRHVVDRINMLLGEGSQDDRER